MNMQSLSTKRSVGMSPKTNLRFFASLHTALNDGAGQCHIEQSRNICAA
ncbi:MAG: hypothetical protein ACI85F_000988 [Bacteroidia bacterium]|jgi:hypothetical protein